MSRPEENAPGPGRDGGPRAGHTRDARGKSVRLLDPVPLFMLGRHDVIERDALNAIMMDIEPRLAATGSHRTRRRIIMIVVFTFIALAAIAQIAIIATGDKNAIRTLTNPVFFLPAVAGTIVPFVLARAERLKKLKRVMLKNRRCPHCGYGLRGRESEEDGATLCPECGCAWHLAEGDDAPVPQTHEPTPRRTKIVLGLLIAGAALFVLLFVAFLIHEFNN